MSYLEIDGRRHPIPAGDVTIGCDSNDEIALGRQVVQSKGATLQGLPDGQVAIRSSDPKFEIRVNGVRLGPQPTPLLHGDKIEVAGRELLFVDDRRGGSTSFIQALDVGTMAATQPPGDVKAATAGTGGRLVSLTDGREYTVAGGSLLLGREAGCDVVVESKNVSRRHAEIVATPKGYLLIDSSTNGTIVNGRRVEGQRLLAQADVIRCGDYEFRFYADALAEADDKRVEPAQDGPGPEGKMAASPAPQSVARAPEPAAPGMGASPEATPPVTAPDPHAARVPTPPPGAAQQLAHTLHGIPAVPRPKPGTSDPPQSPRPAEPVSHREGAKRGPLAALRGLRDKVRPGGTSKPKESATPTPPDGADRRLANTMHGIPTTKPPATGQPAGAHYRLQDTMHGIPLEAQPGSGQVESGPPASAEQQRSADVQEERPRALATFVMRSGPNKGERMMVRLPVVNIGRADYNDIVLSDDSVSTVHAKLQRREGVWVLVDQDSTNGTVVDGTKIKAETALAPGAIVRFGQISTVFEPMDDSAEVQKGSATRVIQSINLPPPADPRRRGSSSSGP